MTLFLWKQNRFLSPHFYSLSRYVHCFFMVNLRLIRFIVLKIYLIKAKTVSLCPRLRYRTPLDDCFSMLNFSPLIYSMLRVPFYSPCKNQKSSGFLMFPGDILNYQWAQNPLTDFYIREALVVNRLRKSDDCSYEIKKLFTKQ